MKQHPARRAGAPVATLAILSLIVVAVLAAAVVSMRSKPTADDPTSTRRTLTVYCAAGIKGPIAEAAAAYTDEYGAHVEIQYAGSGTLLSQIEINPTGDLYIAADDSYIALAREKGLAAEAIPLATLTPVLAVRAGNPRRITSLDDLTTGDVAFAMANPDAAAIGKITRAALTDAGRWTAINDACSVFKPTVNDAANDVVLGAVDAAIVWDATVAQTEGLEAVHLPLFDSIKRTIEVTVLRASRNPTTALRFARYLSARDRGGPRFDNLGYGTIDRDLWAERPELLLYAGSMFNQAIEDTVNAFETREGVEVTRVYNGCGILVAQMKAGGRPDAYFSCDQSFMDNIAERFSSPRRVSENPMVIVVPEGNPKSIHTLDDLARDGLRVGLAHPEKSALGHLTQRLLEHEAALDALTASGNWVVDAPQGDFLVNQLQTGGLDAAIVYISNASSATKPLDIIEIKSDFAIARQPYAVARDTDHAHTMRRLLDAILTSESRSRFEDLGLVWVADQSQRTASGGDW